MVKNQEITFPIWQGEINLKGYDNEFEEPLKKSTEEFYKAKTAQYFQDLGSYEYIQKIANHLLKEENNANLFLQEQTKPRIIDIVLK